MNLSDTVYEKFKKLISSQSSWKGLEGSQFVQHVGLHLAWAIEDAILKVERAYQESYVDTALNRSSILAMGEGCDYVPRKPVPASGTVLVRNESELPVSIAKGRELLSDGQVAFAVTEAVTVEGGTTAEIPVVQRTSRVITHTVTETKPWYEILLDRDLSPTIEDISVAVDLNDGKGSRTWTKDRLFTNSYPESLVYDEFYHFTDQLGVRFGNGEFGTIPPEGSIVTLTLTLTNGDVTLLSGQSLYPAQEIVTETGEIADVTFTVGTTIGGGSSQEDTEEMRRNVHYARVFNERLVWAEDYVYFLRRTCPDIVWGKCWGEETAEEMWGYNVHHINHIWLCAHSPERTDDELKAACLEAVGNVPSLNKYIVWYTPELVRFSVKLTGEILQSVDKSDVEAAIRAFLAEAYGDASKTRRENVLIHEMYEGIYATGYFEKGSGAWFSLEISGTTKPEYIYQMVCIDLEASSFSLSYAGVKDTARIPGGVVDREGL